MAEHYYEVVCVCVCVACSGGAGPCLGYWQGKLFTDHGRHMGRLGFAEDLLLLLGLMQ